MVAWNSPIVRAERMKNTPLWPLQLCLHSAPLLLLLLLHLPQLLHGRLQHSLPRRPLIGLVQRAELGPTQEVVVDVAVGLAQSAVQLVVCEGP